MPCRLGTAQCLLASVFVQGATHHREKPSRQQTPVRYLHVPGLCWALEVQTQLNESLQDNRNGEGEGESNLWSAVKAS